MEILIAEIKKRSVLWNRSHCRYKDRRSAENEWNEVAKKVGIPKEDAKKKWRNLRDQFSKELKKIPRVKSEGSQDQSALYTGKWQYFKSLLFLKDSLISRETDGNVSALLDDSTTATEADNEISNTEANDIGQTIAEIRACTKSTPIRPKRKRIHQDVNDMEGRVLDIENKKVTLLEAGEDETSLFLRSLHPFMKKLDPIRQLRVRTKFQDILLEEMEAAQS